MKRPNKQPREKRVKNGRARAKKQPPRFQQRESPTSPADGLRTWTIRCVAHLPSVNTVEVQAETLEEACAKAITITNDSPHWQIASQSGRTFIDGYCEGVLDGHRGSPARLKTDVPYAFSEDGLKQRPTIKIYLSGGVIQDVTCDGAAIVIVHDADNEAEAPAFDPYEPSEYRFPS
ncbi:MAG: hypothetical protein ACLP02_12065 [Rhodomicrobium sp.]